MLTQQTKYGNIVKAIGFYAPDKVLFPHQKTRRIDQYTSKVTGETENESVICINEHDTSDQYVQGVNGEYNPVCYGCWSGIGHTIEKHNSHKNETIC